LPKAARRASSAWREREKEREVLFFKNKIVNMGRVNEEEEKSTRGTIIKGCNKSCNGPGIGGNPSR
jgi:hypothetical protein